MAFIVRPKEGSDPFRIFSGKKAFLRHQKVNGVENFLFSESVLGNVCCGKKI